MATSQPDHWAQLAAQAQADPAVFADLYDGFVQPVYRYLYRHTGNAMDAEDLTAQTFLAALEALPRYQERGHFAAWLFAIARSKAMAYFRAKRPQVSWEAVEQNAGEADPLGRLIQSDERARLMALIRELETTEQELINLRYVASLTFAEMAVLLGKKEEAVKKSFYRLVARLQSQLEAPDA